MMKIRYEFDSSDDSDLYHHSIMKQSMEMFEVLQDITGRYGSNSNYRHGFKNLLKYDGLEEVIQDTIKELGSDDVNAVVYGVVSRLEEAFYGLLREHNINLDI